MLEMIKNVDGGGDLSMIVAFAVTVFQLILFAKVWEMAGETSKIRELLEKNVVKKNSELTSNNSDLP